MSDYSYNNLIDAYSSLGVSRGKIVYVVSALRGLGSYNIYSDTLDAHYHALRELVGDDGTIVVPTATLNLCNTNTAFNLQTTPSYQMGSFSEYIRNQDESIRSCHPFWSLTALGKYSDALTNNISSHAFSYNSVWSRMIDKKDVLMLHVGLNPGKSLSIIHYAERLIGVPYRYTKEFKHPVVENNSVVYKDFYMDVMYKESGIIWDKKKSLMIKESVKTGLITEYKMPVGSIWSSNLTEVLNYILNVMSNDFYYFLEKKPYVRPYEK